MTVGNEDCYTEAAVACIPPPSNQCVKHGRVLMILPRWTWFGCADQIRPPQRRSNDITSAYCSFQKKKQKKKQGIDSILGEIGLGTYEFENNWKACYGGMAWCTWLYWSSRLLARKMKGQVCHGLEMCIFKMYIKDPWPKVNYHHTQLIFSYLDSTIVRSPILCSGFQLLFQVMIPYSIRFFFRFMLKRIMMYINPTVIHL